MQSKKVSDLFSDCGDKSCRSGINRASKRHIRTHTRGDRHRPARSRTRMDSPGTYGCVSPHGLESPCSRRPVRRRPKTRAMSSRLRPTPQRSSPTFLSCMPPTSRASQPPLYESLIGSRPTPRLLGLRELTYNVEELRHYFCNWRVVNATVLRTGIEVCLIELRVPVTQFTRQLQQL